MRWHHRVVAATCVLLTACAVPVTAQTTNTRYVNTASTAGGDGTTNATSGANRAYASLSEWETARDGDLVTANTIEKVFCEGSAADTTAVDILGWTTGASNYIDIVVDPSVRHNGTYQTTKYRLEVSNATAIEVEEAYVRFTGLQVFVTGALGARSTVLIDPGTATSDVRISQSIVKLAEADFSHNGIAANTAATVYVLNTLVISDGVSTGSFLIQNLGLLATMNVYSVTGITAAGLGIRLNAATATVVAKNVLIQEGGAANAFQVNSGTLTNTNCASSDATADDFGGSGNRVNQTFTFVGAPDYHLAAGDAGAKDFGTDTSGEAAPLNFTVDIDNVTRTGTWDIGADADVAAGGSAGCRQLTLLGVGGTCS